MQDENLTLEEKKECWVKALERKDIDNIQSKEEYYYELETYQVLYEDENVIFAKEYGNEFQLGPKNLRGEEVGGISTGVLDFCLDYVFESDCENPQIIGMSFGDYIKDKGYPINFKTWGD